MRVLFVVLFIGLSSAVFAFKVDAPKPAVSRPQTPKNTDVYPRTTVSASKPVTSVTVSKPSTPVGETVHPRTPDLGQIRPRTALGGGPVASSSGTGVPAASSATSASAGTSMSGYKPKEAKDFKAPTAAAVGGGEAGLGAAAAASAAQAKAGEAANSGLNAFSQEKTQLQSAEKAEKSVSNLRGGNALEKKAEEARRSK